MSRTMRLRWIALTVLLVVAFAVLLVVAPPAPGLAGGAPSVRTLFHASGSGIVDTRSFTAPGRWAIDYSVDCSSASGPQAFGIDVHGSNDFFGTRLNAADALALSRPVSSTASGTVFSLLGGRVFLRVLATCPWTITAKG